MFLNNSWAKDEIKCDNRKCFEGNGQTSIGIHDTNAHGI